VPVTAALSQSSRTGVWPPTLRRSRSPKRERVQRERDISPTPLDEGSWAMLLPMGWWEPTNADAPLDHVERRLAGAACDST
jgi:hypothetical protein